MFFNPSLRTRNSFEAGMFQLGGHAHSLEPSATLLPALEGEEVAYQTERVSDVARTLPSMGTRSRFVSLATRSVGTTPRPFG